VSRVAQNPFHAYDHIEIPEIKPEVTRVTLHRGLCPCCGEAFRERWLANAFVCRQRTISVAAQRRGRRPAACKQRCAEKTRQQDQRSDCKGCSSLHGAPRMAPCAAFRAGY
jgi:hypothetical protein